MKTIMILLMTSCLSLTACVSKQIDGISLNRSIPERMTDIGIERQALSGLDNIQGLSTGNHRVAINAFRGKALLTGEVPSEQTKQAIANMTSSIAEVNHVYNRLTVGEPKSQSHTVHENYLKTKLSSKLLTSGIKQSQYSLVVRNDIAYVMGVLTYDQLNLIEKLAQETEGVRGFTPLADILATQEQYNSSQNQQPNYGTNPNPYIPNPSHSTTQKSGYINLYQGKNAP